jgi:phage-related protein
MRFVEFKLPEKDSPLFNEIFSELSDLVELTRDLPEENTVRQQVAAYLEKLTQNANVSEDAVEDAENALIIAIAKQLGGSQATMALMDIKKFKQKVQAEIAQVGTAYQEKGKDQVKSESTEKLTKA